MAGNDDLYQDDVLSREQLEELWGGPLPEITPEHQIIADTITRGRKELAPYIMMKFFPYEEAKLAVLLPGTAEDVAAKAGRPVEEVRKLLDNCAYHGRIMKWDDGSYSLIRSLANFKDYVLANGEWDDEYDRAGFRMMHEWDFMGNAFTGFKGDRLKSQRITPKWESIKDIPGVMPCENIPESFRQAARNGTVAFTRCPCRTCTYKGSNENAEYVPTSRTGIDDGGGGRDPKQYVCITGKERADYMVEFCGAYRPTMEEVEERIIAMEASAAYYCGANLREYTSHCCCADDVGCTPRVNYDKGNEDYFAKSRFLAYLDEPDACVGCGTCENICQFKKSVRVIDGKAQVDENRCHGCGVCVTRCPSKALKMKLVRPPEHIPRREDLVALPFDGMEKRVD